MLIIVFFKITIFVILGAWAFNSTSGIESQKLVFSSSYWVTATLLFPYKPQLLGNLLIISYGNNGNNRNSICCSFLSTSSSTSSISFIKFILISGFFITTIYITVFYSICYYCILSTYHYNKKLDKLKPFSLLSLSCILYFY